MYADPEGESLLAVLLIIGGVVGGGWTGGAAANDWEWEPTQWDYSNPSTIFGMVFGGLLGGTVGGIVSGLFGPLVATGPLFSIENGQLQIGVALGAPQAAGAAGAGTLGVPGAEGDIIGTFGAMTMPAAPLGFEWIRNQIDSTWASWSGGGAVPVESRVSHMDGGGGGGNRDTYYSDEEIDKHFRDTNGYGAVVAANTEFSALALHASLWRIGEALNNGSLVVNQAAKIGSRVRIVWEEWEIELVTGGLTGIDRGLFVLNKIVEGLKAEGFSLQKSSRC